MADSDSFLRITPRNLLGWLTQGREVSVVDVLPPEAFARKHLPGAKNACVYRTDFLERMQEIVPERDREVVLYGLDTTTHEADAAAVKLAREGWANLAVLEGGIRAWTREEFGLEGDAPDEPRTDCHRASLATGDYEVDAGLSSVLWRGRSPFADHRGTIDLTGGVVRLGGGKVRGEFTLSAASIADRDLTDPAENRDLIAHLLSDDFLYAALFPRIDFIIESSRAFRWPMPGTPNYELTGELRLRGVNESLCFPATLTQPDENTLLAEAHFDFDRTRWGASYGSGRLFGLLGRHLVFDDVSVSLRLVARRTP